MDDGPVGGKDRNESPLQLHRVEAPQPRPIDFFEPAVNDERLHVEQLTAPPVNDAKLKAGPVAIGRNQCRAAVENARVRPREAGEYQSGGDGEGEQPEEGL